jgi:hypothetical protein
MGSASGRHRHDEREFECKGSWLRWVLYMSVFPIFLFFYLSISLSLYLSFSLSRSLTRYHTLTLVISLPPSFLFYHAGPDSIIPYLGYTMLSSRTVCGMAPHTLIQLNNTACFIIIITCLTPLLLYNHYYYFYYYYYYYYWYY